MKLKPVTEVAASLGITEDRLIPYGRHIAKVARAGGGEGPRGRGSLVLVTSMTPTPEGTGKTTLAIGLAQSLRLLGRRAAACLRQPSLGPLLGIKGGATGSGLAAVHPEGDISLHFTGDDDAVTTAHNLVSSVIDNHIHHGNPLGIDPGAVFWKRASRVNDRALRRVRVGIRTGAERDDGFIISAASELMSVLCVARSMDDLSERLTRIIVARDHEGAAVTLDELGITGVVAALLSRALLPNLVQSTEGVPVFIHGGPFGNISLGCNTLAATTLALDSADIVLTEAGFATDLGAEKFFDIVCRTGGLKPGAAVVVATLRALRLHGGSADLDRTDGDAAIRGIANLTKHVENIERFGVPAVVVINRFADDPAGELSAVMDSLKERGVTVKVADVRDRGGAGGVEAAEAIVEACEASGGESSFAPLYPLDMPIREKAELIAREIYGAACVRYTDEAAGEVERLESSGLGNLAVCVAKTHMSLSDDPKLVGRPEGFEITARKVYPVAGAGFVVVQCGPVLLMPGLPEHPRAEAIGVDRDGNVTGL